MYSFEMTSCDCCAEVTLVMKVADLHIMVILHLYFCTIHGIAVQAVHLLSGSSGCSQLYNYMMCIHFVSAYLWM